MSANPYYEPEALGLTKVAELDLEEPCYSFNILAVWHDEHGFYLGTDSGCSCPVPFELYNGRDSMTGPLTAGQAIEESKQLALVSTWNSDYTAEVPEVHDQAGLDALVNAIGAAA